MVYQIRILWNDNLNTFEINIDNKQNVNKWVKYDQVCQNKSIKEFLWLGRNPIWLGHHHKVAPWDKYLVKHFLLVLFLIFQSFRATNIQSINDIWYHNYNEYDWSHINIC